MLTALTSIGLSTNVDKQGNSRMYGKYTSLVPCESLLPAYAVCALRVGHLLCGRTYRCWYGYKNAVMNSTESSVTSSLATHLNRRLARLLVSTLYRDLVGRVQRTLTSGVVK